MTRCSLHALQLYDCELTYKYASFLSFLSLFPTNSYTTLTIITMRSQIIAVLLTITLAISGKYPKTR